MKKAKSDNKNNSEELTEEERLFCYLYQTDRECFGKILKSYMAAYNLTSKQYRAKGVNAYAMLINPKIATYLNKFLEDNFNDASVDRELSLVILQNRNISAKLRAIKEYNKLKNRIPKKTDESVKSNAPVPLYYLDRIPNRTTKN